MSYLRRFWDGLLDTTILFSFDSSGFKRHQKKFSKIKETLNEKTVLITGATSGIGKALTFLLAKKGASLVLCSRHKDAGKALEDELKKNYPSQNFSFFAIDLADLEKTAKFIKLQPKFSIDCIIHNAGGMPIEKSLGPQGVETIFSSQVLAPYLITVAAIEDHILKKEGRVIFVSSGGALLQKLSLKDLNFEKSEYNHYKAYANAKRAQLVLTHMWSEKYKQIFFASMHPGWVDTPGVKSSMPVFYKRLNKRLRTKEEGADTAYWLACSLEPQTSGFFWFDRQKASEHPLFFTRSNKEDTEKLITFCQGFYEKYHR